MSTTSLPIRSTHTDAILKVAIVAAVAVAAVAHVPVIGPHLEEAPYMGVLFIAFTAVCLGLGAAMALLLILLAAGLGLLLTLLMQVRRAL